MANASKLNKRDNISMKLITYTTYINVFIALLGAFNLSNRSYQL